MIGSDIQICSVDFDCNFYMVFMDRMKIMLLDGGSHRNYIMDCIDIDMKPSSLIGDAY